ncbi:ammonium transporter [Rhodobium gokarnense]|uniref:Ammonium transporter n=1 Tax=Rhodobium gokarnense TaxID=364296 RepID=A0ABT3HGL1_9HYPH|nr:ammonium transporter [Rhodobium gokarnense]MCW2309550.1 ammonium transporter [Rhodobium gokarnense]
MQTAPTDTVWLLSCAALLVVMRGGFVYLESGLVQSKNAINASAKSVTDMMIATICFSLFGYGLVFGDSIAGIVGGNRFFLNDLAGSDSAVFIYYLLLCTIAAIVISAATVERMRFAAYMIFALSIVCLVVPVVAHWWWNDNGWLRRLGAHDLAGATVVHSVGGWAALAAVLVLGPRQHRFSGRAGFIISNNFNQVAIGFLLILLGWIGCACGALAGLSDTTFRVVLNTVMGAAAGGTIAIAMMHLGHERYSVIRVIFAAMAGLVATSAAVDRMTGIDAMLVGAVGGLISVFGRRLLERLKIDDGNNVLPVHLFGGIWGTLVAAFFLTEGSLGDRVVAQMLGIVVTAVWAFGVSVVLMMVLDKGLGVRVSLADEARGLDEVEHGHISETNLLRCQLENEMAKQECFGAVDIDPNTEIGQLITLHNEVVVRYREAHRQWRSQLAQEETANDILRTRTTDLEQALVAKEARIEELMKETSVVGARLSKAMMLVANTNNDRDLLLGQVGKVASAHLSRILHMSKGFKGDAPLIEASRMIEAVARECEGFLQVFKSLQTAVDVQQLTSFADEAMIDVDALVRKTAHDKRKIRAAKNVTIEVSTGNVPHLFVSRKYFADAIATLVTAGVVCQKRGTISIRTAAGNDGLSIRIEMVGKSIPVKKLALAKAGLGQIFRQGSNAPDPMLFEVAAANRTLENCGGSLNITCHEDGRVWLEAWLPATRLAQEGDRARVA